MSTVAERRQPEEEATPEERRWTIADLAAMPANLPSGPASYEIWDGELRLMSPMGDGHGSVQSNFTAMLKVHGEWQGHGRVTDGDVGVVIRLGHPETLFGADVVFLTADQLPARKTRQDFLLTAPALVVEVRSKNDTVKEIREKARRYLEAGVRVVWVADQRKRTVTVYRPGEEPQLLTEEDELTAAGIIPNMKFEVRRLFEGLED